MKKIIMPILSIILGALIAVSLILIFTDTKKEVYIKSSYNDVKLTLGKTKVKRSYTAGSSRYDNQRAYVLNDTYNFYEEFIVKSKYYNKTLEYIKDNDDIYGYLIKDNIIFKYMVTDELIKFSTTTFDCGVEEMFIDKDYNIVLCDFIKLIHEEEINDANYDEIMLYSSWDIFYESEAFKYNDIVELYKCMNQDMVKIANDGIYLKGYNIDMVLTSDYIVKIINLDGYAIGTVIV